MLCGTHSYLYTFKISPPAVEPNGSKLRSAARTHTVEKSHPLYYSIQLSEVESTMTEPVIFQLPMLKSYLLL